MLVVNDEVVSLYDVACRIYDSNMMLRAIAELDVFQQDTHFVPCWQVPHYILTHEV